MNRDRSRTCFQRLVWRLTQPQRERRWRCQVTKILNESDCYSKLKDEVLRQLFQSCRWRIATGAEPERQIATTFAVVRELSRRRLGMAHHPVQVYGALAMAHGHIAEMQTGEGKTLTALMPIALFALCGHGCHVITANDYLAKRDAEFARPVLESLGFRVAALEYQSPHHQRRAAYLADVTYGTEKEFGFDFLRDRLQQTQVCNSSNSQAVQRGHAFAIVDEADSLLIDQAKTPLIISVPKPNLESEVRFYRWCDQLVGKLSQGVDFRWDETQRTARLTNSGCRKIVLSQSGCDRRDLHWVDLYRQVERSLMARHGFETDRDYAVVKGRVEIIDPSTGRVLPGRKWRDGLQQAIEVSAEIEISERTDTAARITLQSYLRRYGHLCGMTGTARPVRGELRQVYGTPVTSVPTHAPCCRLSAPPRVFRSLTGKYAAVVQEVREVVGSGRSVLVGTTSLEASERLGSLLEQHGFDVRLLHALHHEQEATVVAEAGWPKRVTVATNMAGRGTDIQLSNEVRARGGLHVIATEMNRSARVDLQLRGRCARQGDPGSYQLFVSLDDDILFNLTFRDRRRLSKSAVRLVGEELPSDLLRYFQRAQMTCERRDALIRRQMMEEESRTNSQMCELGLDPVLDRLTDDSY